MSENIQCYFTRRSQLNEQLEAIEDNVKEAKAYITNLNGIPSLVEELFQKEDNLWKNACKKKID